MKIQGDNFKFYFNNESKTREEIEQLIDYDTTVSIKGFDVHYFSPKKEIPEKVNKYIAIDSILDFQFTQEKSKIKEFLKEDNMHRLTEEELERQEQKIIKDWNKIDLPPYKETPLGELLEDWCNQLTGEKESKIAYKETEGKLFYELDWGFITQMAERMASNKKESKYDLWNWKKPMTPKGIEDLKQATLRHLLAVMDGIYEDDGREFGHIEAISAGMMMINYQLKNNV